MLGVEVLSAAMRYAWRLLSGETWMGFGPLRYGSVSSLKVLWLGITKGSCYGSRETANKTGSPDGEGSYSSHVFSPPNLRHPVIVV
jgi:hypothetical protein